MKFDPGGKVPFNRRKNSMNSNNKKKFSFRICGAWAVTILWFVAVLLCAHTCTGLDPNTFTMSTLVGTGTFGSSGDGGKASSALISRPYGIWGSTAGIMYVGDSNYNIIRKIDTQNIITTAFFTGASSSTGDGGMASSATVNQPYGVWGNSAGVLYVCDDAGYRLRSIDLSTGIVTTIVGTGVQGSSGDNGKATSALVSDLKGVSGNTNGNLYFADATLNSVRRVDTSGIIIIFCGTGSSAYNGENLPATSVNLNQPYTVLIVSPSVYIAENGGNRVRVVKVVTGGGTTTFAGNGQGTTSGDAGPATQAGINAPLGVAIDVDGNVYIAGMQGHRIHQISTNIVSYIVAGTGDNGVTNGVATASLIGYPRANWIDSMGVMYIPADGSVRVLTNISPTSTPSQKPTLTPTTSPTISIIPTIVPSRVPSIGPSITPTMKPTTPTIVPSRCPTVIPSLSPSNLPTTLTPTIVPTRTPTTFPSLPPVVSPASYYISLMAGVALSQGSSVDVGSSYSTKLNNVMGISLDTQGSLYYVEMTWSLVRKIDTSNIVSTYAGSTAGSNIGDGGAATSAAFWLAIDVFADSVGQVYVLDKGIHQVRLISSAGIVSLFAGSGLSSSSGTDANGDGGAATAATFTFPTGLYGDTMGTIFVSDSSNYKVRKISGNIIQTVMGTGTAGFSGDLIAATSSQLAFPLGICTDSTGGLYIADYNNNIVFLISYSTQTVAQIKFGTGVAAYQGDGVTASSLNGPLDVWADSSKNVYIVDSLNNRIRFVKSTNLNIYTVAGTGVAGYSGDGGPGTSASISSADSIVGDTSGIIYFADGSYTIRRLSMLLPTVQPTVVPTTAAPSVVPTLGPYYQTAEGGNGGHAAGTDGLPATSTTLNVPHQIYYSSHSAVNGLLVADSANDKVRKISPSGILSNFAGSGSAYIDGAAATTVQVNGPFGVCVDNSGTVYVAVNAAPRVLQFSASSYMSSTLAGTGTASSSATAVNGDNGPGSSATLKTPYYVHLDTIGNIYVADYGNNRVRTINSAGIITTFAGTGAATVSGTSGPATQASVSSPAGVYFDSTGRLFIAEFAGNYIKTVTSGIIAVFTGTGASGTLNGPASSSQFHSPYGVYGDSVGNIFIADGANHNLRAVTLAGIVSTIAGTGGTLSGIIMNSMATSAPMSTPSGVHVDSTGIIHVTDSATPSGGCIVRRLSSLAPTFLPTVIPSASPTIIPTLSPSVCPTLLPSTIPSLGPSVLPTVTPTVLPTVQPSCSPTTIIPSVAPTLSPSQCPSLFPSVAPTLSPSRSPTLIPSVAPTLSPTVLPTVTPTMVPSVLPSAVPTTIAPSVGPTLVPSQSPSLYPTVVPTIHPSICPTLLPSVVPSLSPTVLPTLTPTVVPTIQPSCLPTTIVPSVVPSLGPTILPTVTPTVGPTIQPSLVPTTILPSVVPTICPTVQPSFTPTIDPTLLPSIIPTTNTPSIVPTFNPSVCPSLCPSVMPTFTPSHHPTQMPSHAPTITPVVGPFYQSLIAGTGNTGVGAEGVSATSSAFNTPYQTYSSSLSGINGLLIADYGNNRVRRVTDNGIVSTIAGSSSPLSYSDGVAATSVSVNGAIGVCVDGSGAVIVVGYAYQRVFKFSSSGYLSSVLVGTGAASSSSTALNGDNGPATSATLHNPYFIFIDTSDNLYLADSANNRIRSISSSGTITSVAGAGSSSVSGDSGAATQSSISNPTGVYCDSIGRLYIAEQAGQYVKVVESGIISVVTGTGTVGFTSGYASSAQLRDPYGVYGDSVGNIFISDTSNRVVRGVTPVGIVSTMLGTGSDVSSLVVSGMATSTAVGDPQGIHVDSAGCVYISDFSTSLGGNNVRKLISLLALSPTQSPSLSQMPSLSPTIDPSTAPSNSPTTNPTVSMLPTLLPSAVPSIDPSVVPSRSPSLTPSVIPSLLPTRLPSFEPSLTPSVLPSICPTVVPSVVPTVGPSLLPSVYPSIIPSLGPTVMPTTNPSVVPSLLPSIGPSIMPTVTPTAVPSLTPSSIPSMCPSLVPSVSPSLTPTTVMPTLSPSSIPSMLPSIGPSMGPTLHPTAVPSLTPSTTPSVCPSLTPTVCPSVIPSVHPSLIPSPGPTLSPSSLPTYVPSVHPSILPSILPSALPSTGPSPGPSCDPSRVPSGHPSGHPSLCPTVVPTLIPTLIPSHGPTVAPSCTPTAVPSAYPSPLPTSASPVQTSVPTPTPSVIPSTIQPSTIPSVGPTVPPTSLCPSVGPSVGPSVSPSITPSVVPSIALTASPSLMPSLTPSEIPSLTPSESSLLEATTVPTLPPTLDPTENSSSPPSTCIPTADPTPLPSFFPSSQPISPSECPSVLPSLQPTVIPSIDPSIEPSVVPSVLPSFSPSVVPSIRPSLSPSVKPTLVPSVSPSLKPSLTPSVSPSVVPSLKPTVTVPTVSVSPTTPTLKPSRTPSVSPSVKPTRVPSALPTLRPTIQPTVKETAVPTAPTAIPTLTFQPSISEEPSVSPTEVPTTTPTGAPVIPPSNAPTLHPSDAPTVVPTTAAPSTRSPTDMPTSIEAYRPPPVATLPSNGSISVMGSDLSFKIVLPFLTMSSGPHGSAYKPIVLYPGDVSFTSYVVYGNSSLPTSVSSNDAVGFSGTLAFDSCKRSVAVLGDVNGDGQDDLIIGDPYASRAYVLFGTHNGLRNMTQGFTIFGETEGDLTGWSVSGAGDVNNDTLSDIIVGAPFAGRVGAFYVIYGRKIDNFDVYLNNLTASQGFALYGSQNSDFVGVSVSNAGDVNGDRCDDVIVGGVVTSSYFGGVAVVVYGCTQYTSLNVFQLDSLQGFKVVGTAYSYSGYTVSNAGDVNKDGYDDVIVGTYPQRSSLVPSAYVIFGSNTGPATNQLSESLGLRITGGGAFVSFPGDINHDGYSDIMVSGSSATTIVTAGVIVYSNVTFMTQLTATPSTAPSKSPTRLPTKAPILPSVIPTRMPTVIPSRSPTAPTFAPTPGASQPSSTPSAVPTLPTIEPSEAPTEVPTQPPSQEPSEHPSMNPTESPTESPTVAATVAPSVIPTIDPSAMPSSLSPTAKVLTRAPYSAPTRAPSVRSSSSSSSYYTNVYISGAEALVNRVEGYQNYIVNTNESVSINNIMGHNQYTVLPHPSSRLTIVYFNATNDIINITAFSIVTSFDQLLLSNGSVIVTLPNAQIVHILNLHLGDLYGTNFVFYQEPVITEKVTKAAKTLSVVAACLIGAGGLVLGGMLLFRLCGTFGWLKKVPTVVVEDIFLMRINYSRDGRFVHIEAGDDDDLSVDLSDFTLKDDVWHCRDAEIDSVPSQLLSEFSLNSEGDFVDKV